MAISRRYHQLAACCLALLTGASTLSATSREPWFDTPLHFYCEAGYSYQADESLSGAPRSFLTDEQLNIFSLNLYGAVTPNWAAEVELLLSDIDNDSWTGHHLLFELRRSLLDDIIGDPVALTAGVSAILPFAPARRDIRCIYHGAYSMEATLAIGKEWAEDCYPCWRLWGLGALGAGRAFIPWVRTEGHLTRFFFDAEASVDAFVQLRHGFGSDDLILFDDFSEISYRYADVGFKLQLPLFSSCNDLSLEAVTRLYGEDCIDTSHRITLTVIHPFSI